MDESLIESLMKYFRKRKGELNQSILEKYN